MRTEKIEILCGQITSIAACIWQVSTNEGIASAYAVRMLRELTMAQVECIEELARELDCELD